MKRFAVLAATALATLVAVVPLALARTHASTSTTVNVTAKDFRFVLSRRTAPHGIVVFHIVNKGKTKHDFKIAGKKTSLIKPGAKGTLRVTLKKGRFAYLCTVPGHAQLGMKGVFRAT
jgi:uncharacterized cupredoxin-like copper-binding protein